MPQPANMCALAPAVSVPSRAGETKDVPTLAVLPTNAEYRYPVKEEVPERVRVYVVPPTYEVTSAPVESVSLNV